MKSATLIACICLVSPTALVSAQDHDSGSHTQQPTEPINTMCPVGKEPIVPSAGTVEYKGKTIGLCCPGCGKQFLAWDEARKDEFVAMAIAMREPGLDDAEHAQPTGDAAATDEAEIWTDPYPLDTCPITGQKLGSMGEPIVKKYDGREVRFCCAGCISKFEADLDASWKKVDEAIVEDQMRYYPVQTCVVSGEPLFENGEDIANNVVYGNRLVRLCCKMCEREFKADPKKYIEKLDEAAAEAQRDEYPLDTCVVAGGKLGSMGDPVEMVIAGRLLRFCCAGCNPKAEADPMKYIEMIDLAWQAKGMYLAEDQDDAHENDGDDGHGDHGHDDHDRGH